MSDFKLTVNNQEEEDFLLSRLKPEHKVLEFGSGSSTIEIAKHVKHICSIEHHSEWFERVMQQLPPNAHLCWVPQNSEPEPGHDGTKKNFNDYVQKSIELCDKYGPFDVIFIDGRARVACAEICEKIGHKDTLVFIHDYNHPNPQYLRDEYFEAEQWLERVDGEFTMWLFKIKALQTIDVDPIEDNESGPIKRSEIKTKDITERVKETAKKIANMFTGK